MIMNVDRIRAVGHITFCDFIEGDGERAALSGSSDINSGLKLDSTITLTTHHIVDVVCTLRGKRTQQETIIISLIEQHIDLGINKTHYSVVPLISSANEPI